MTPGTSPVLALHRKLRLDENGSGDQQNANSGNRGAWRRAPPGRARVEKGKIGANGWTQEVRRVDDPRPEN